MRHIAMGNSCRRLAVRTAVALVRNSPTPPACASVIRDYTRVGASHPGNSGTSSSLPPPAVQPLFPEEIAYGAIRQPVKIAHDAQTDPITWQDSNQALPEHAAFSRVVGA